MYASLLLEDLGNYMDESPRADSKLEWWFIHGRFSGVEVEERYFMASLFRSQIPDEDGQSAQVFSVLISILDPRSGRQWTSSRVDRRLLEAINTTDTTRRIDPFSPQVVLDELRACGLPREFESPATTPRLSGNPLSFEWGDLKLAGAPEGVVLAFHEPRTRRLLRLELQPVTKRLTIEASRMAGPAEEAMEHVTYPRMHLEGSAGGQPIEGEAWFDHQWGGSAWLQSADSPPRVRGWDWLGFQLDDGSAWVVMAQWDAQSSQELCRSVTMRDSSGDVRVFRSFEWEPVRWWRSPATRIRHPVAWTLNIPECEAALEFEPFADHQEIRVFGPQRAIWEGAGRMRGLLRGRSVEGAGRLEGQGRGYIFDFTSYTRCWAERVDRELAVFLPRVMAEHDLRRYAGPPVGIYEPSAYTSILAKPLWDLIGRDGKRWRAVLSYLLLDALGRDAEPLRDICFVLPELLHTASLIIDDIQDDSAICRGQEAIHCRYGLDVAISSANTTYFLPLLLVLDHPLLTPEEKHAICDTYQRQLIRAHLGQSLDLFWTHGFNESQLAARMADSIGPKILQMYALKTAAPVEGVAQAALTLAQADESTQRAVLQFARSFGLAFQLIDDVNNFTDSPEWGKQQGEDLKRGKLTYLLFRALQELPAAECSVLRGLLCRPDLRAVPAALHHGIDLVLRSGACTLVRKEARDLVAPAWEALSRCIPPSSSKTELRLLWESLVGLCFDRQSPIDS